MKAEIIVLKERMDKFLEDPNVEQIVKSDIFKIRLKIEELSHKLNGDELIDAYIEGMSITGDILSRRFKDGILKEDMENKQGLLRALEILHEYGC